MSHFEIEESVTPTNAHYLWVEKYRPTTLKDYIGNDLLKETMTSFIENGDIPHLLLYGSTPGTGKTSMAKLLTKNIPCDVLYLNASDESGVDVVRTKIKGFASTTGFNPLKVIILDEADGTSHEFQTALRNLIETFSLSTRFILTANYIEKLISPLVSRCQTYQIHPISKKEVATHLKKILDLESVGYTMEDLGFIVNTYYPDIRKVLNFAQQSVLNGKLKISNHNAAKNDAKRKIIDLLKTTTSIANTFTQIRQLIADNDVKVFEEYYTELYQKSTEYAKDKDIAVIMTIAEYVHQSCLVVDKEITFMACIAAILKVLK